MPRICLNMIVRNEEHVIRRCLRSCRPWIDCWAIADTGSTDKTMPAILEELAGIPGRCGVHQWRDFATNRTAALELARSLDPDYILVLDADHELQAEPGWTWPALELDGYSMELQYGPIRYHSLRLFKASVPWVYREPIHEYPWAEGSPSVGQVQGIWQLVHHDGARFIDPATYRRDALVLEADLIAHPRNERSWFYLAQTYKDLRMWERALECYRQRVALRAWSEEAWYSLYMIASIGEWKNDPWPDVLADYLTAYSVMPDRAEPLSRIASAYERRGDRVNAGLFRSAAELIPYPAPGRLFVEPACYAPWKRPGAAAERMPDLHENATRAAGAGAIASGETGAIAIVRKSKRARWDLLDGD